MREIAAQEGVTLIDLAELVTHEPEWAKPETIYYDGMHVNDDGARIYARLVATALAREVLPRLRAAQSGHSPQIMR